MSKILQITLDDDTIDELVVASLQESLKDLFDQGHTCGQVLRFEEDKQLVDALNLVIDHYKAP